jgi:hypothetical protein
MLSGTAIRQMLWILLEQGSIDPSLYLSQVKDRKARYAATRELEQAGLIQVVRVRGKESQFHVLDSYISIYNSGSVIEAGRGENHPLPCGENHPLGSDTTHGYIPPPGGETTYGYDSLEDEAEDIDSMPDEGRDRPAKANTPFRTRRKQQRIFVQKAWGEIYPNLPPLIDANANEFLKLCDESAYEVLLIFREFQGSAKACWRYLRKVAENKQAKRAGERTEGTISSAPSGSVNFPGWESDEAYYAHQEKMKAGQKWLEENGYSDDD